MSLQRITCGEASGDQLVHVCDPCERELGRIRGVCLVDGSFDFSELITKLKQLFRQRKLEKVLLLKHIASRGSILKCKSWIFACLLSLAHLGANRML